jgi:hypothetical protein
LKARFAILPVFAANKRRIFIKFETSTEPDFRDREMAQDPALGGSATALNGPFTMGD